MARPNLSDPAELKQYRRELRAYRRPWRVTGLLMVIGACYWLLFRDQESVAGWTLMATGWVILLTSIVLRTRYHLRRMREPA